MPNDHLIQRLEYLLEISKSIHVGGKKMSSSAKGIEREFFINQFLSMVIAPPFRLGCGDVTDSSGNKSGQMDIVVEYGNSISFPLISSDSPRLYLAEGVCAVVEVKSDLVKQWDQVINSHQKLSSLKRNIKPIISMGSISENIPYFVVGYQGWKTQDLLKNKIDESGIDGILVLDPGIYQSKIGCKGVGPSAIFAFLAQIQRALGDLICSNPDFQAYFV